MDILYTTARNKEGNFVKAIDAEKGEDFFCPTCNNEFILKKSGRIGKGTKRPHFAHKVSPINCTPETALHFFFKNLLAERIEEYIKYQKPLHFSWKCKYCHSVHEDNLLKKIVAVEIEYNLTICQPDIALLDKDGNVFAVIEIVVTHDPEPKTLQYYKDNNIIMIQINVNSDIDLENIDEKISKPSFVDACFNPKCDVCGYYKSRSKMIIAELPCRKCNAMMKVAVIKEGYCGKGRSTEFTEEERKLAVKRGVVIKEHYSISQQRKYLANTCSECDSFIEEWSWFPDHISCYPLLEEISVGYHCDNCIKTARERNLHSAFNTYNL